MRGDLLFKALTVLYESVLTADEFFESLEIIAPPPGVSVASVISGWHEKKARKKMRAGHSQEWRRLHSLLERLKRDQLIEVSEAGVLSLSLRGRTKLRILKRRAVQVRDYHLYPVVKDSITRVVSFDVPEDRRLQRKWLRGALTHLEFRMRQQSFWVGTTKLPAEFIRDLIDTGLLKYVEILAVTKRGTLKEIV